MRAARSWSFASTPRAGGRRGCSMSRLPPGWSATNIRRATARCCSSCWVGSFTKGRRAPTGGGGRCRAQQIEYALDDVRHLEAMRDKLNSELERLGRLSWMEAEMLTWQDSIDDYRSRERWRQVSGMTGLSNRSLAIVRELWRWREQEAERRDLPPRRVLRDDLIIELAKRKHRRRQTDSGGARDGARRLAARTCPSSSKQSTSAIEVAREPTCRAASAVKLPTRSTCSVSSSRRR